MKSRLLIAVGGGRGARRRAVRAIPLPVVSLVITNGLVVTMNPGREIVENGGVAIDGADIVAVGPEADVTAPVPAAATRSMPGARSCCRA